MTIDNIQLAAGQRYVPLLPRLARTATPNQKQVNSLAADIDSLIVVVDVTNVTATGSLTVKIEGVDPQTNDTFPVLTGAAITAAGVYTLQVHPAVPAVANQSAQAVVPPAFRVTATHGNGVSITYSVTALITE